jgi:hypothetical protein
VSEPQIPAQVDIHYEKNPLYRTIYVDGAIGGPTPTGSVNLTFFSTRSIIPKSVKHNVAADGKLSSEEISKEGKTGIMREIEMGVYMSPQTAKDIYEFLKKIFEHAK